MAFEPFPRWLRVICMEHAFLKGFFAPLCGSAGALPLHPAIFLKKDGSKTFFCAFCVYSTSSSLGAWVRLSQPWGLMRITSSMRTPSFPGR